jgi:hypothetical protein
MSKHVHSLQSIHAHREGDTSACSARGTKRVAVNSWEVTCRRCQRWDDENTCYTLSPQGAEYVKTLERGLQAGGCDGSTNP